MCFIKQALFQGLALSYHTTATYSSFPSHISRYPEQKISSPDHMDRLFSEKFVFHFVIVYSVSLHAEIILYYIPLSLFVFFTVPGPVKVTVTMSTWTKCVFTIRVCRSKQPLTPSVAAVLVTSIPPAPSCFQHSGISTHIGIEIEIVCCKSDI